MSCAEKDDVSGLEKFSVLCRLGTAAEPKARRSKHGIAAVQMEVHIFIKWQAQSELRVQLMMGSSWPERVTVADAS